jgi:hypothetical protein
MLDLNNIPEDDNSNNISLIPDGTIVRAFIKLKPGDIEIPEFGAGRYFKQSQSSSAKWCELELTVNGGDYHSRKVWHKIFVDGDKLNDKGISVSKMIGLKTLKAIIDSAFNLSSKDQSPEAQQKRSLQGIHQIEGLEFCFTVKVEKGTNGYNDQNGIKIPLTPDMKGYIPGTQAPVAASPAVAPQPTQQQSASTATAGVVPTWAQ